MSARLYEINVKFNTAGVGSLLHLASKLTEKQSPIAISLLLATAYEYSLLINLDRVPVEHGDEVRASVEEQAKKLAREFREMVKKEEGF